MSQSIRISLIFRISRISRFCRLYGPCIHPPPTVQKSLPQTLKCLKQASAPAIPNPTKLVRSESTGNRGFFEKGSPQASQRRVMLLFFFLQFGLHWRLQGHLAARFLTLMRSVSGFSGTRLDTSETREFHR